MIQIVRTDNGSEFLSPSFQHFLQTSGIIHQQSCAYTPQLNGCGAATYLINRFPTTVLGWKSPYEALHNRSSSYSHLRTIGCLCFAIKPEPHVSKFDRCASKCMFIGYPLGQKAYKVYDLETKSIFVSKNVIFHEDQFPFSTHNTAPISVPLPNIPLTDDVDDILPPSSSSSGSPPSLDSPICSSPVFVPAIQKSTRTHHRPAWLNDFEPRNHKEAVVIPHWIEAMKLELEALERNGTWRTKLHEDGSVERHKARLVAKGYTQVEVIDYTERFSPVAKCVTVRLFLALASAFQWPLHQIDINNSFLHGHLEEEIYMTAPEGYLVEPGHACLLKRWLYGLKQTSRKWNAEFTRSLEQFGFQQSRHDHCLFFKAPPTGFIGLLVKAYLDGLFTIKDLGSARYFLGLQIALATPLPPSVKLQPVSDDPFVKPERYRRLIGRLLYLCFTRPDLSHVVQQLSQFMHKPCQSHWHAAMHLVRYLRGCSDLGLFFPASNSLQLQAFCNADWGACLDSRCSLTGFAIYLGSALISWKTKKQSTVSCSSAEAEYRSMAATTCELKCISYLLRDFGITVSLPIPFHCDNQAAIHIMVNPVFHECTKHLDIDCHIVWNCYRDSFLLPVFVRSRDQVADLFTKPLSAPSFTGLLGKLGLFAVELSPTCGERGGLEVLERNMQKIKLK
ncbi:UNVERIFIED_CONTAM: Retrovirus-related Pol polyprotein from transposon RE2 [Sesamum indicum]